MAQATSISVSKLHKAVNAAVAAAGQKFPNFKPGPIQEIAYYPYWICGFPVPDPIYRQLQQQGLGEVNAIAGEIAGHLQGAVPEAFAGAPAAPGGGGAGALYAFGGHIIIGRTLAPPLAANIRE
jgi:hypothetical protein